MTMTDSWLFWVLISMLGCAFSSSMEMAFISASHLKIELDKKQGLWSAKMVSYWMGQPKQFLSSMLIGNNIGLVIFGIKLGDQIVMMMEKYFPFLFHIIGTGGVVLTQTVLSTIVILLFGEFLPKMLVTSNPNRWLNVLAFPLLIWYIALWPFAQLVNGIAQIFIGRGKQDEITDKRVFGRVDLDDYLEKVTGQPEAMHNMDHEIEIFQKALDFSKVKARDCMIPRNEIVAVSKKSSIEYIQQKFIETHFSKILVYGENIDDIIGYVHSFDLFQSPKTLVEVIRPVCIVPEAMAAQEILSLNIREKRHVFIVVDEFGGTAGMATLEDVIEEIVGEIQDEHDAELIVQNPQPDGTYIFNGREEVKFINEEYHLDLPEDEERYDTLGGLILSELESLPQQGDELGIGSFRCVILEVSDQKIEKISLQRAV
jgi:putative hemolysin